MFAAGRHQKLIVLLNAVFVLYCAATIMHLKAKAIIPTDQVSHYPLYVDGVRVNDDAELEFLSSERSVGNQVRLSSNPEVPGKFQLLEPFYSGAEIIFDVGIALVVYFFGLAVYLLRKQEPAALVFHSGTILIAAGLIGLKSLAALKPPVVGGAISGMFFFAYTLIPVVFLQFTYYFPHDRSAGYRRLFAGLYGVAVLIALAHWVLYLLAIKEGYSIEKFDLSLKAGAVQNMFVLVLFVAGFTNVISVYRRAGLLSERRKLRWIFFGLCVGPAPFIFLWVLPQAFGFLPLIPEFVFKLFLLAVPLAFSIAIVKYRALDIDVIINRGVVYIIAVGVFLGIYLLAVAFSVRILAASSPVSSLTVSVVVAVMTSILFEPVRKKIQNIVDRSFFRVQYDFRIALRSLSQGIVDCGSAREIAALIVGRTQALIPVERIGIFSLEKHGNRIQLLAHSGFEMLERHGIRIELDKLRLDLKIPLALPSVVEQGSQFQSADEQMFLRWGIGIVIPLLGREGEILGFLALGPKRSGFRFSVEDVDLFSSIASQSAIAMERLTLRQNVLFERAEAERLAQLSEAKSYFVSSVSHDLKTPLTSIKLFAELMKEKKQLSESERESYLNIIEGESDRLARLINNVLDFSKVERGIKEYEFATVDLNELVKQALETMRYQFVLEHCKLQTCFEERPMLLRADGDAMTEMLYNLLSNALRYTPSEKKIEVRTFIENGTALLVIRDNGIGMTEEEISRIFIPFYRSDAAKQAAKGGTGLGLPVVKHIVDSHRGTLEVASVPGRGSTFTVRFPLVDQQPNTPSENK